MKVYLVADPAVRASRRQAERPEIGADALATDLKLARRVRPARACSRPPTRCEIDTTELAIEDVDRADRGARPRAQPALP